MMISGDLDGVHELEGVGFGRGAHAEDDDERDEAVVGDDLRLLHRPRAPLLHAPSPPRSPLRSLPLRRNPRRHG